MVEEAEPYSHWILHEDVSDVLRLIHDDRTSDGVDVVHGHRSVDG